MNRSEMLETRTRNASEYYFQVFYSSSEHKNKAINFDLYMADFTKRKKKSQ
jgi:hypothetical protein